MCPYFTVFLEYHIRQVWLYIICTFLWNFHDLIKEIGVKSDNFLDRIVEISDMYEIKSQSKEYSYNNIRAKEPKSLPAQRPVPS